VSSRTQSELGIQFAGLIRQLATDAGANRGSEDQHWAEKECAEIIDGIIALARSEPEQSPTCSRRQCSQIPCRPSPSCTSGNHCIERTPDGLVLVRDAKQPYARPEVLTTAEFENLT
jgi:hypothetical protein